MKSKIISGRLPDRDSAFLEVVLEFRNADEVVVEDRCRKRDHGACLDSIIEMLQLPATASSLLLRMVGIIFYPELLFLLWEALLPWLLRVLPSHPYYHGWRHW